MPSEATYKKLKDTRKYRQTKITRKPKLLLAKKRSYILKVKLFILLWYVRFITITRFCANVRLPKASA